MKSDRIIAVTIPCYNEELMIAKVVKDFKRELPQANIYVLDNRSTDRSAERAREAGATVIYVPIQGKGAVVRHIFREIDADIYVMVDGDDTYPAESVHDLIRPIEEGLADMAVGDRLSGGDYALENKRILHGFGNVLVQKLVNFCFASDLRDVMTGFRAFSRRFAHTVPVLSNGFEVETEMTIRCLDKKLPIAELSISYRDRPEGSHSKLNTFRDGFRVLKTIFTILKDYRPLVFFGTIGLVFLIIGLFCGLPVIEEFIRQRYISRVPLAILATGFVLVATILLNCALVLDTLSSQEKQRNELGILSFKRDRR